MIDFLGLGHINVVVDDIDAAIKHYIQIFNAKPQQIFRNFKNVGFSKSAGFMQNPGDVNVSIAFLEIPSTSIFIELMEYHYPVGELCSFDKRPNTRGGVGHVCIKVKGVERAFDHVRGVVGVTLISNDINYKPYKIDPISINDFVFFDEEKEKNKIEKEGVCKIIEKIKYFYFIDKYGVQWELEEGHHDIGS